MSTTDTAGEATGQGPSGTVDFKLEVMTLSVPDVEDSRVVQFTPPGSPASIHFGMDPDGNGWLLQEITTRLPGRV